MDITLQELYKQMKGTLTGAGRNNPAPVVVLLLTTALGITRQDIMLHGDRPVPKGEADRLMEQVQRLISGEPVQYILGEWEFYGRRYKVGKGVLIPREDTYAVLEQALAYLRGRENPLVADLCSGSGCIAVTLCCEVPNCKAFAVECSIEAFGYLMENGKQAGQNLTMIQGDIFDLDILGRLPVVDVIISNPPYIRTDELSTLQIEVQQEPRIALDGGVDGLAFYRGIIAQYRSKLKPGGLMAFEVGYKQSAQVAEMFKQAGFCDITVSKDINGIERAVCAVLPGPCTLKN